MWLHCNIYYFPTLTHWPKSTTGIDSVRLVVVVHLASLLTWRLTGGQFPRFPEYLGQEWGVQLQVTGHHIEAEEVTVNTLPCRKGES